MFYIIEMQTNSDGTSTHIVQQAETINTADQIYYSTLSFAAVSNIYQHTVVLLRTDGSTIRHDSYKHEPEETV